MSDGVMMFYECEGCGSIIKSWKHPLRCPVCNSRINKIKEIGVAEDEDGRLL